MQDLNSFIVNALSEDIGSGDFTTLSTIQKENTGEAICLVKEDCILAGVEMAKIICEIADPSLKFEFLFKDGETIKAPQNIGSIKGSVHSILKIERLLLNCMQRMSAIATKTNHLVQLLAPYQTQILDTRKTTPNFRIAEKWAVKIGGGINHRFGLYDQILIKDNHIKAAGGIQEAIDACASYLFKHQMQIPVIVEVKNTEEFLMANNANIVDRILVDNFTPAAIKTLIDQHKSNKPIEASGGINEQNILEYAQSGVNYVSLGDLTHHVQSVDISLKIV
jgi:nicotinate-nucleotide pyrophosphorylase (carboxylating)